MLIVGTMQLGRRSLSQSEGHTFGFPHRLMVGVSSPRVAIPRVPPQPRGAEAIQARAGRPCDLGGVEARTTRDGGLSKATQRLHQGQESAISTSPKTTGSARFTSDGPRSTCYEEDIYGRVVIPEKPALHTAAVLRASSARQPRTNARAIVREACVPGWKRVPDVICGRA